MSERPPIRLIDDPEAPKLVREAIAAGREDLPSTQALASLASRLGPLLGPGGGPGGPGPGGSAALGGLKTSAAMKTAAALVIVGAAALGGAMMLQTPEGPARELASEPEIEPAVYVPPQAELPPPLPIPEGVDPPEPAVPSAATARDLNRPRPALDERPSGDDLPAELSLIQRIQAAIQTDPTRALALTEAHRARFPNGRLIQEREVGAVEALVRLGRQEEARSRVAAFHDRWPHSAHGRRLDVLLGH